MEAAKALKRQGAKAVYGAVTHAVLSGDAIHNLDAAPLEELMVTDTIPLTPARRHRKITVLSVAPLLAEAIRRIHDGESISSLFDGMPG